ncbi:hypothetical protein [Lusitaniella coriacea]|uniref:hypothetical protein n=1 Tax=Lusitaniella coriacea TaxID=1983105 RepID=UPI003CF9A8D2
MKNNISLPINQSSQLAIKIDGVYFPMEKIIKALNSFRIVLVEIDKETALSGQPSLAWSVTSADRGSIILTTEANIISDDIDQNRPSEVINTFKNGLQVIAQKKEIPYGFSIKALKSIKTLSGLIDPEDFAQITFKSDDWELYLEQSVFYHIDELTKSFYRYYDAIEGHLVSISLAKGVNIGIRDITNEKIVKCYFSDRKLLETMKDALGKRVIAFGLIAQAFDGSKINIHVEDLKILRDANETSTLGSILSFMRGEEE